jgi:hypothetical protein
MEEWLTVSQPSAMDDVKENANQNQQPPSPETEREPKRCRLVQDVPDKEMTDVFAVTPSQRQRVLVQLSSILELRDAVEQAGHIGAPSSCLYWLMS